MHRLALVLLPLLVLAADKSSTGEKTKDLCSPPPGIAAPSLPAHIMTGQGRVHFPITTTNPKAQEFFDQGVAQMHSFWAMEAERSFLQAAALDPEAPMPQWGIAMVAAGDYRGQVAGLGQRDSLRAALAVVGRVGVLVDQVSRAVAAPERTAIVEAAKRGALRGGGGSLGRMGLTEGDVDRPLGAHSATRCPSALMRRSAPGRSS